MSRVIRVFGEKEFKLTIPDDSKVTFGPWSPPGMSDHRANRMPSDNVGTLRIYGKTKDDILAVFSGVHGFREETLGYTEKVNIETGQTVWKDDQNGYTREQKVQRKSEWINEPKALPARKASKRRGGK
jgi:hypothetical protein